MVVAEALANLACVGRAGVAVVNCCNFGNPEHPEVMWQLSEAIDGMTEACLALGLPVIGGNVSLYNESGGADIPPTPVIGVLGLVERPRAPAARERLGGRRDGGPRSNRRIGTASGSAGSRWAVERARPAGRRPAAARPRGAPAVGRAGPGPGGRDGGAGAPGSCAASTTCRRAASGSRWPRWPWPVGGRAWPSTPSAATRAVLRGPVAVRRGDARHPASSWTGRRTPGWARLCSVGRAGRRSPLARAVSSSPVDAAARGLDRRDPGGPRRPGVRCGLRGGGPASCLAARSSGHSEVAPAGPDREARLDRAVVVRPAGRHQVVAAGQLDQRPALVGAVAGRSGPRARRTPPRPARHGAGRARRGAARA